MDEICSFCVTWEVGCPTGSRVDSCKCFSAASFLPFRQEICSCSLEQGKPADRSCCHHEAFTPVQQLQICRLLNYLAKGCGDEEVWL